MELKDFLPDWGTVPYFLPGVGEALSAKDSVDAANRGDWLESVLAGLGAIPGIGMATRSVQRLPLLWHGTKADFPERLVRETGLTKGASSELQIPGSSFSKDPRVSYGFAQSRPGAVLLSPLSGTEQTVRNLRPSEYIAGEGKKIFEGMKKPKKLEEIVRAEDWNNKVYATLFPDAIMKKPNLFFNESEYFTARPPGRDFLDGLLSEVRFPHRQEMDFFRRETKPQSAKQLITLIPSQTTPELRKIHAGKAFEAAAGKPLDVDSFNALKDFNTFSHIADALGSKGLPPDALSALFDVRRNLQSSRNNLVLASPHSSIGLPPAEFDRSYGRVVHGMQDFINELSEILNKKSEKEIRSYKLPESLQVFTAMGSPRK